MAITDIITLALSLFLLWRGACLGFWRSLFGPLSVIAASVVSIVYYQMTQNMLISLLIGLFGPFVLNFLLVFFLKSLSKPDAKAGVLSRAAGSAITLLWGWVFVVLTLILLAFVPPWGKGLMALRQDVDRSVSYSLVKPLVQIFLPKLQIGQSSVTVRVSRNEAETLSQDSRFQTVLQDPQIQKEIQAHDYAKLMSNPKMMALTQQIMSDPATMKKVMAIYQQQTHSAQHQ